jgi:proline dehydrogenase
VLVFNTFQNYLKSTKKRVQSEIQRCLLLKEPLAVKLVRGAYMVEETGLAKKKGEESPIHNSYEDTEKNYHDNIQYCLDRMTPVSRFMLASHNERSIRLVKDNLVQRKQEEWMRTNVEFAQLMGFADHMSYSLLNDGYKVSKYLPFGELDIMIPYLVRRAQESKQMFSSANLQSSLMKHEIGKRLHLN